MENSEKIFLLTNEGVDYFIDTETYRLFTDSEQKTINVPQLVGVSGAIATVLGILFKGNILMINPENKFIVVLLMWLIIIISSIFLPIYQIKRNKRIISSGRLIVKKIDKSYDAYLFNRIYRASIFYVVAWIAPLVMVVMSIYFIDYTNVMFLVALVVMMILSSISTTFIITIPKRYKLLRKMKKEGIF